MIVLLISSVRVSANELLFNEDFEGDLSRWAFESAEQIEITPEPRAANRVLRLAPKEGGRSHAIVDASRDWRNVRFEGRFLFPTEGHGYLGFIYNYREKPERTDFGCIYVKSNGSYVRVSPHHDGNPSWRLYEDFRFDLEGERRIRVGTWHRFRLDVRGRLAELYVGDMTSPVVGFDLFPGDRGALGLEARPGFGEPVWVDDVRVTRLPPSTAKARTVRSAPKSGLQWEIQGPAALDDGASLDAPELLDEGWRTIEADPRGAMITGLTTQYSGEKTIAYLRARFEVAPEASDAPTWLALSSAN
ncbi:MAG: hypothetical protein AAF657_16545, partial [Acidobacteriota bacterium]